MELKIGDIKFKYIDASFHICFPTTENGLDTQFALSFDLDETLQVFEFLQSVIDKETQGDNNVIKK